jgi:hypothetical protein
MEIVVDMIPSNVVRAQLILFIGRAKRGISRLVSEFELFYTKIPCELLIIVVFAKVEIIIVSTYSRRSLGENEVIDLTNREPRW